MGDDSDRADVDPATAYALVAALVAVIAGAAWVLVRVVA